MSVWIGISDEPQRGFALKLAKHDLVSAECFVELDPFAKPSGKINKSHTGNHDAIGTFHGGQAMIASPYCRKNTGFKRNWPRNRDRRLQIRRALPQDCVRGCGGTGRLTLRYGQREGGYLRSSPRPRISRRPCSLANVQQIPSPGRQGASSIIRSRSMPGACWDCWPSVLEKPRVPDEPDRTLDPTPFRPCAKSANIFKRAHKTAAAPIGFGRKAITHGPSRARR
uniref:Uncharacterized protein n=1 Tax=Candidatus Kentrum sp. FM TaxID=2126340 RepID=A0A450WMC7_9GAMM|nr:MAG: hypothetical protein BECKFM1743A_GA0114220_104997 [Candidatus Kentron sp. FM]VFJ69970.1 MAG: hypothetical protein BECKFM1743C_GA0114222_105387 [Candidatus Kentron sp. FM]VFK18201.1 MAG: hypothetical protein BECKFM1743B_GA0114221_105307 [Candidatus Kentron sp. FM]